MRREGSLVGVVLLAATSAFGQFTLGGGGYVQNDNHTGLPVASVIVNSYNGSPVVGKLTIVFSDIPVGSGDWQNGGCPAGGTFTLNLYDTAKRWGTIAPNGRKSPVLTVSGILGPNGPCTAGPTWQLLPEGATVYSYFASFNLVAGPIVENCILRTAYQDGLWTRKKVLIQQFACSPAN